MTRSDIGIVVIIYATCLLFLTMTLKLKAAAQVYPLCLIGGLALLNTLYLGTRLWRLLGGRAAQDVPGDAKGPGARAALVNDLPEIFANFVPGQFLFIVIASVAYLALMHFVGFYPAGFVYMLAVMRRLRVPPLHMGVTLAVLGALIYAVFTLFLKVPLPRGILFG